MTAAVALLACLVAACSGRPPSERGAGATEAAEPTPAPRPEARGAPAPSIYELGLALTAERARATGLDVDRGHPTLISMFYGSCTAACPMLVSTIDRTLGELPAARRAEVRVLLVSFDPRRDTPARLAELHRARRLDDRWTLAAASEPDARTLAAVLGIRYRATADGQFFHTSAIIALDADGRPIARMDGLGDPAALVAALAE